VRLKRQVLAATITKTRLKTRQVSVASNDQVSGAQREKKIRSESGRMKAEKFYVLDQNAMQVEGELLPAMLCGDPGAQFIVPDVGFEEMIRPKEWELTFRLSLAFLSQHPTRAKFAGSIYDALRQELATGKPITSAELFPHDFNEFFQQVLQELGSGRDGPAFEKLKKDVPSIRQEMLAAHLDPKAIKQRVKTLVETWLQVEKTGKQIRELRKMPEGDERDARRLAVAKLAADEVFLKISREDLGLSQEDAAAFLGMRPMTLRYLYGQLLDSLNWARSGSQVEAASERLVGSRQFDMHYAILATYFDGLLSKDAGANAMYEDLRCLLQMKDAV
jgi:hypothetical protein